MAQPVHKVRAGQVSAAIWENEATVNGKKMAMLKATVERRYRDASGAWRSSNSFSRNEIPLAVYALQRCFEHMVEAGKEREDSSVEEETVM